MAGSFNSWALNTTVLNGEGGSTALAMGEGLLLGFAQNVTKQGSGLLISIDQEVIFFQVGEGQLISIEQEISNTVSDGRLITITQLVKNNVQTTFLERNGWYPVLTIGNQVIPDDQVAWPITITRTENDAAQMTFTLLPPRGVQNLSQYEGQRVTLDMYMLGAPSRRLYTGWVNIPDVDIITKHTSYTCSDLRREQINSQMAAVMPLIGFYSEEIFGKAEDLAAQLDQRLTTTLLSVDFDSYGNYFISNTLPKAIPDITFTPSQIYRDNGRSPTLQLTTRSRVVNSVNVELTYQYTRLYYRRQNYEWSADWPGGICGFLTKGYSLLRRDTLKNAADGAGWPITDLEYVDLIPAGWYRCDGGVIGFSTRQITGAQTLDVVDSDGNNITDTNGNKIQRVVETSSEDSAEFLCMGATWTATKRWSQNIIERYSFNITAPQSIAKYGVVQQNDTIGVASLFDATNWEDYTEYALPPSNAIINGMDHIVDVDDSRVNFTTAFNIGMNRAISTILRSHRDNKATYTLPINPYIELYHTVKMTGELAHGGELTTQGKVYQITHTIDISQPYAETKVTLAFSQAQGSAVNTPFIIPPKPTFLPVISDRTIDLTSHYPTGYTGGTATTFPNPSWTGFVGNAWVIDRSVAQTGTGTAAGLTQLNSYRTQYQESFTVPTPEIPSEKRDNKYLDVTQNYTIGIGNDLLEVEY